MKAGSALEQDVKTVYSYLLNMKDEGVVVANNVFMTGKSGVQHEIDVYYEFARAGIRHRVTIECKDWASAVSKGNIQEFESKLRDIGNITGVVVSRNGYQSGADTFAKHCDILPLVFDDLPSWGQLLGGRLRSVALPDETYIGEPFWIIMEVRNGKATGSHFSVEDESGQRVIPLMYSKPHAERFFAYAELDDKRWGVRGLPKHAFRAFLLTLELYEMRGIQAGICMLPPGARLNADFVFVPVTRDVLVREYLGESIPSITNGAHRGDKV
ncbi:restriction endonuclease [Dyella lutea]|uniref:Restriction endonuclease n=1 Tax=Dyella lutea TaxID=2950441 RepID=A0ABT1FG69_9GAMM|nr:restriction endonuclease [Dyella lutea]MCP1375167.1 restriction endonuclease [Dyella lutea]